MSDSLTVISNADRPTPSSPPEFYKAHPLLCIANDGNHAKNVTKFTVE